MKITRHREMPPKGHELCFEHAGQNFASLDRGPRAARPCWCGYGVDGEGIYRSEMLQRPNHIEVVVRTSADRADPAHPSNSGVTIRDGICIKPGSIELATTFVSPMHVDNAALATAMMWFAQARGGDQRTVPSDLDEKGWCDIPFTRKPDLRVRLRPYPESGRWIAGLASSGTTAEPVESPWSEADEQVAEKTVRAVHLFCPSIDGARCAVIAPSPTLAVAYSMRREIELNGGIPSLIQSLDPKIVCRRLVDDGIEVVFTLPLVASRIGEYFMATRGTPPAEVRLLFCGGDVLSPARQTMLANMWDAFVLNMFGCSELFGPIAGPGEQGDPLVWHCEPAVVEVIDPVMLSPCGVGDRGVMVLSTLWPKASPLLRYWTDDIVRIVETTSSTGRFVFDYVGRPPSMLNLKSRQVSLNDIDNALLSNGWCTSEWSVHQARDRVVIEAEMPRRQPGVLRSARELLGEIVGMPVEVAPKEPGSIRRATPKFTVMKHD